MRISYWSSDVCSYYIVDHHEAVRHARPRQVDAHPEAVLAPSHRRPRAGRSIMGQKSNPIGLRLQINRTWDSRWFAEGAAYGRLLMEDLNIRADEHTSELQSLMRISYAALCLITKI